MQGWKNNNDPWEPLPQENGDNSTVEANGSNGFLQAKLPLNPLHQMMDSETYIKILGMKCLLLLLNKLKMNAFIQVDI